MFEKIINSKLFQYIMTVTIAILTVILTQGLTNKREITKGIKDEMNKKAPYEYVDKQDANITNSLEQHIRESNETDRVTMELIRSIDSNVKVLLNNKR